MNKRYLSFIASAFVLATINIASADQSAKDMTCEEIAAKWNVRDWDTLSDRAGFGKEFAQQMGITLPVSVPPEGCRMVLEGGVGIKFGKEGKVKLYCHNKLLTREKCVLKNFSIHSEK